MNASQGKTEHLSSKGRRRNGAEMRQRILDAAAALLVETGYARTSTWAVCARAAVSRGALLHHFPTRTSLFTAAATHLAQAPLDDLDRALERTPPQDQPALFLNWLWSTLDGDLFAVGLELLTAARTEPELRIALRAGGDALQARLEAIIDTIIAANEESDAERLRSALLLSIPAVRGVGLDLSIGGDRAAHRGRWDTWRAQVARAVGE